MDEWREEGKRGGGWKVELRELEPEPEPEHVGDDDEEEEADSGEEALVEDEDEDGPQAGTPSKKRKTTTKSSKPTTPRKRQRTTIAAKSTSRAKAKGEPKSRSVKKKVPHPKSSTSNLPATILPENLPSDPYERALRLLHVGATPDSLPCREEEFVDVLSRVEEGVEGGGGGCLCEYPTQ